MRLLNEPMARIANSEDDTLVTCMVYADLNPIKAGIARTPEASDYTSIQRRIRQLAEPVSEINRGTDDPRITDTTQKPPRHAVSLPPAVCADLNHAPAIGISLESYIELVVTTADALRQERTLRSSDTLQSLGIKPSGWMRAVTDFVHLFRTAAGTEAAFTRFMQRTGRTRRQDAAARRLLFA